MKRTMITQSFGYSRENAFIWTFLLTTTFKLIHEAPKTNTSSDTCGHGLPREDDDVWGASTSARE